MCGFGVHAAASERQADRCVRINEGAKYLAEIPVSSDRSEHIDARYHFIRGLVR